MMRPPETSSRLSIRHAGLLRKEVWPDPAVGLVEFSNKARDSFFRQSGHLIPTILAFRQAAKGPSMTIIQPAGGAGWDEKELAPYLNGLLAAPEFLGTLLTMEAVEDDLFAPFLDKLKGCLVQVLCVKGDFVQTRSIPYVRDRLSRVPVISGETYTQDFIGRRGLEELLRPPLPPSMIWRNESPAQNG